MDATPGANFPGKVIAQLLGITERRLQQLAAAGYVPKAERGLYPLIGSVQGYIGYLKERNRDGGAGTASSRLHTAQAVRVEMENRSRLGELVQRVQVHEFLSTIFAQLTASHEGIPGRTANEYAAITDPAAIRQRQQEELRAVRTALADAIDEFAESLEHLARDLASDAAGAEADAEHVGGQLPDSAAD